MAVDAAIELPLLAKRLQVAGEIGIRREMLALLRAAAKPMVADLKEQARKDLPKGGGMNEFVAKRNPRVSVRTGMNTAGASIRYTGPGRHSDISGGWRHPVFGHRDRTWATTTSDAAVDWWRRGGERALPEVQSEMRSILATVAAQVNGHIL